MFVPSDSSDYSGRLAWLYFAEARGTLTDGEKRDIVYLERHLFGTSREDEARILAAPAPSAPAKEKP